jgi:dihydrofolate reductase
VSDTYTVPVDNPWHQVTSVIGRSDAAKWLSAAKERGGGDILIFGSRRTWNGLVAQGPVDELHLMISPAALGDGNADLRGSG